MRSTNNSTNSDELFKLVGQALTSWTGVEAQLSAIAWILVEPRSKASFNAAFAAIVSLDGRLAFVESAAEHSTLTPALKYILRKSFARVRKVYRLRNEIAHAGYGVRGDTPCLVPFFNLSPKFYSTETNNVTLNNSLVRKPPEIESRIVMFVNLRNHLRWVSLKMYEHNGERERSPLPIPPQTYQFLPHMGHIDVTQKQLDELAHLL